jgi:hypothetical protein
LQLLFFVDAAFCAKNEKNITDKLSTMQSVECGNLVEKMLYHDQRFIRRLMALMDDRMTVMDVVDYRHPRIEFSRDGGGGFHREQGWLHPDNYFRFVQQLAEVRKNRRQDRRAEKRRAKLVWG